jgi:hypothetical protein
VPTEYPTYAGQETTEAVAFTVSQPMAGITATAFTANENNEAVFIEATAQVLGVSEADIKNVQVADARRRRLTASDSMVVATARGSRRLSSSITITYDVVLEVAAGEDSTDVYNAAVDVIVDSTSASCSSSCLATIISEVAAVNGVSSIELTSATVTAVSSSAVGDPRTVVIPSPTATPSQAPSDDASSNPLDSLSTGALIGITAVLALCLVALLVGLGVYIGINLHAPSETAKVMPVSSVEEAAREEKGAALVDIRDNDDGGGDGDGSIAEWTTRPAEPVQEMRVSTKKGKQQQHMAKVMPHPMNYEDILPHGWVKRYSRTQQRYFYRNDDTGETRWDVPTLSITEPEPVEPALPLGWVKHWSNSQQRHYYHNDDTGETRWNM